MMESLIGAFPDHPVVLFLIALGALVAAIAAIWRLWLRPVVEWAKSGVAAAIEIVELLRDIRDFFREELPGLKDQISEIKSTLDEHMETEDARLAALEAREVRS